MSRVLRLLLGCVPLVAHNADADDRAARTTNAPVRIELRDQFNTPQTLTFPTTQLTLLTIANRKGSEQIDGWVEPVKQRFGDRIDVCGIADVSNVPGLLRGTVRKAFQRSQTYPVLMDWSGDAVKRFGYVPEEADILLLDRDGRILQRHRGAASDGAVQQLFDVIKRALATETAGSRLQTYSCHSESAKQSLEQFSSHRGQRRKRRRPTGQFHVAYAI